MEALSDGIGQLPRAAIHIKMKAFLTIAFNPCRTRVNLGPLMRVS